MNKTEELPGLRELFNFRLQYKTDRPNELLEACCLSYSDKRYRTAYSKPDDYKLLTTSVCLYIWQS